MSNPRIDLPDPDVARAALADAPPEVEEHFDLIRAGLRHIPWLTDDAVDWDRGDKNRALTLVPELFDLWWLEEYYVIKCGSVDAATKELLALAVATRLGCQSCVPYHAGAARYEGAEDDLVASMQRFDQRPEDIPDSLRRVLEVGLNSVYCPGEVTDDDIESVRQLGYTDAEIVELVVCAHVSFKNAAFNQVLNLGQ